MKISFIYSGIYASHLSWQGYDGVTLYTLRWNSTSQSDSFWEIEGWLYDGQPRNYTTDEIPVTGWTLYNAVNNTATFNVNLGVCSTPTPTNTPTSTPTNTPTITLDCSFDVDLETTITTPTPTNTPTSTPTSTETSTPTITPTSTSTLDCNFDVDLDTVYPTPTPTNTPTNTPTSTSTGTPTITATPTTTLDCNFDVDLDVVIPTPTPTNTPTNTPTSTPTSTETSTPTFTPTSTSTGTPTITATPTTTLDCNFDVDLDVVIPTPTPTNTPTVTPTSTPTPTETSTPTNTPTSTPTSTPTTTNTPTSTPTSTGTPTITNTPTVTLDCNFGVGLVTNYPPTDIYLTNNSINENSSINTIIGTLSTTSIDSSDTYTYSIVAGSSNFNISGTSLRSSQSFNYEAATSHSVTIRVTDSVGQYFDKAFTINVNNVNETPYGINLNNNSQQENTATDTTIGTFTSLDVDSGDTFTYSLHDTGSYPDNSNFTLSSSGVLKNSTVFNYEAKTSYTIRVRTTDAGGLTYDATFTINVTNQNETPTNISLSSSSISENVPTGTTIGTLSATDPDSGDTFTYSLYDNITYPDNSAFFIDGTTLKSSTIFNHEAKSSYSIRIRATDAGGLTYNKTLTITITNVTITVTASQTTAITCNGGNQGVITVSDASGGTANYTYSKDGTNYQVSTSFGSLTAGSYTIYAKDSYGEVGSTIVNVTQPAVVSVSASGTNPTCFGGTDGSISVSSATGGNGTYTYSKDGTNYQASATFSSIGSGSYTIYAKDGNGCVGSTSVTLNRTQVTATVSQTNATCNGGSDGSISVSGLAGGQGGPYSTKLNSGGTYQVITTSRTYSSLSAGANTIYVKDSAGCENTYSVTLTQPTAVTISLSSSSAPTCFDGFNGSIVVSAGGGNGSHQYRINSGSWQSSGTFSSLGSGSYTLQSRDTNGCESSTINVNITKSAPTASVSQGNVTCNGGSNGSISVSSPSGGSGSGYTYSRDGVNYQSSGTFSSLTAGGYDIYIKDGVGCVNYLTTITITQPSAQAATITVNTFATCNGVADGAITLSSSGGTFPKTYRLYADTSAPYVTCGGTLVGTYTGVTSGSPSVSVTGIDEYGYCLEVTDNNGCVTNSSVVETTACSGTCYTITLPQSILTYNGESLYINYTKTNGTFVSRPYSDFPAEFSANNDYITNICSNFQPSYQYGTSGNGFLDAGVGITINGKCNDSQWCGGADPYVPPTGGGGGGGGTTYSCKESPGGPCSDYSSPCSSLGLMNCSDLEEIT